jgi:hypothetical protein
MKNRLETGLNRFKPVFVSFAVSVFKKKTGNTNGGGISVQLTSCLTGLESVV